MKDKRFARIIGLLLSMTVAMAGCGREKIDVIESASLVDITANESVVLESSALESDIVEVTSEETKSETSAMEETMVHETETYAETEKALEMKEISFNMNWEYAEFSAINDGVAMFYPAEGSDVKGITVCVNAGHGTRGGSSYSTFSHPDKSPKCTGGTNANGAVKSMAIAEGTTMDDGTSESVVTLKLAMIVKEDLLDAGYHVLMIRESDDVQLDNIARTVMANNNADCHIALHYDGTSSDKGAFYIAVPDIDSYRSMEPVASMWKKHNRLGRCLVDGMDDNGVAIWSMGEMELDLTQTSYSTIPSVDLEVGDQASDYSESTLRKISAGIVAGLDAYWE